MSRKDKKYHFIYKTTDTRNGNFYVGMHSTDNLNDGYVGSGNRLKKLIYKHGKNIFNIEILEFLPDRKSLVEREIEIVNSDLLKEEKCMNLKPGGSGGFTDENHAYKCCAAGGRAVLLMFHKIHQEKMKTDIEYREKCVGKLKGHKSWVGKRHKEETKIKIGKANSLSQKGNKNSQYGTCWITNGKENKKIKKQDLMLYNDIGWVKGRTIK